MLLEKTYRFVALVLAMTLVAPAKTNLGLARKFLV
jgi:hypothetical protein